MPLRFTLALTSADDPPTGVLTDPAGGEHRFRGWMQLSSALAAAMREAGRADGAPPPTPSVSGG